ncbi:F-actin-monooxygenase MICAL1 isoform X5 [Halichoerus grypus]
MASPTSTNPAHAHFESFLQAQLCQDVLSSFQGLCEALGLEPGGGLPQYHKMKAQLNYWSAKSLWAKLDKRAGQPVYQQGRACTNTKCLVVGAGPCGLRAAVELALLGARVLLVEKRTKFSRHNVLHLWPFTIHDLRALGAKKFYGRFCTGTLDHISIRQLQLLLLKVALLLGVEIHWGVTFTGLQPPPKKGSGWRAQLQPSPPAQLANYEFDVLISAAGGKFVPEGFTVREMRGKLAIGITVNFVNGRTVEETQVPEISGVARIYNQSFFQSLLKATGIDLENIVYYKDDTHYFVMTAKKQCLLRLGVLRQDWPEIDRLLGSANVVPEALQRFVRAAADFATHGKLGKLEFARDAHGRPDISAFDFTSMMRAESSARVQEKHGARLLLGLVGDCLVEPFWPLGTGVARGFLAAFDAAWMVKRWAEGAGPLEVLAERESLYQLLSQTSPENMHRNVAQYGLDPATRYPTLNLRAVTPNQVRDLYDVAAKEPVRRNSDKIDAGNPAMGSQELLRWCQEQTAGYPGVHVTDLSSSWADGRALCALLHRLRPGLLEPSELQGLGALEATAWALKMAEYELGITPMLSAKAVVAGSDPLGLIAYLSHFHSTFKNVPHSPGGLEGPASQGFPGTPSAVLFLGKLQRTLQRTRAQENGEDTGGKKPRLEVEAKTSSTEEPPVPESGVPPTPPSQHQERTLWSGGWCRLVPGTCVHSVGNTSTSWNAPVPMAVSFTGAASAATAVRPCCGPAATGSTQETVSGPGRQGARNLKLEGNWDPGHKVATGARRHFLALSSRSSLSPPNPQMWGSKEPGGQQKFTCESSPVTPALADKRSILVSGYLQLMSSPLFHPSQDTSTASSTCPRQVPKRMALTPALRVRRGPVLSQTPASLPAG